MAAMAVKAHKQKRSSEPPRKLFLHGKIRFKNEEWAGFRDAVGDATNLVGVRIKDERDFKLYWDGDLPVLHGLAYVRDIRTRSSPGTGFRRRTC
jgi:hypothetical protein